MTKTAVIAGVGAGLGASLAKKFAREGCRVGLLARTPVYIDALAAELREAGAMSLALSTDITDPHQIASSFSAVRETLGPVDILVNHAGNAAWGNFSELTPDAFEHSWRVCALGAFLCAKEAAPDMVEQGGGTILFTGATSAIRGRAGAIAFSSAKFAVRGLAWALAREVGPKGVHVAHIIVDGIIDTPDVRARYPLDDDEPTLDPDEIADTYWNLVQQPRSSWTFELDVRPHNEEFFT